MHEIASDVTRAHRDAQYMNRNMAKGTLTLPDGPLQRLFTNREN